MVLGKVVAEEARTVALIVALCGDGVKNGLDGALVPLLPELRDVLGVGVPITAASTPRKARSAT